jgi:DNA-binding winged helix-turn-helix (wHTH) protein
MIYRFDSYRFDTDTQELHEGAEPVHVEPQVLAVLQYLVENRNRVVSKIELLDEVWGDRFVSESALTSRIKSARRVCGDSGRSQHVIRTVHGRGYRFVADVIATDASVQEPSVSTLPADGSAAAVSANGLVGRTAEIDRLESAMVAALSGQRQALFVTGEAGSGKSTLVSEMIERAEEATGSRGRVRTMTATSPARRRASVRWIPDVDVQVLVCALEDRLAEQRHHRRLRNQAVVARLRSGDHPHGHPAVLDRLDDQVVAIDDERVAERREALLHDLAGEL